jgi:alkanesulfonate monooxygenase SsuD/methylene tetrahydromethanopterin reductase-like flavin-dependent oxidoreductase (luciferase family)
VTMLPKPIQSSYPIWLTTNAGRLENTRVDTGGSDFTFRRVGRVANGWMKHSVTPEGFRRGRDVIAEAALAAGRDPTGFGNVVSAVLNIQDDGDSAFADEKKCLDLYDGADYTAERLHAWGPIGAPSSYAAWINRFHRTGCQGFTFRLATMGDAMARLRRLINQVLPLVSGIVDGCLNDAIVCENKRSNV